MANDNVGMAWLAPDAAETGHISHITSLPAPDPADREACLDYAAAMTRYTGSVDDRMGDCIGEKIMMRHFLAHKVTMIMRDADGTPMHDENGEVLKRPGERIVIIDDEGRAYEAVSEGVFASLAFMFSLPGIGHPSTWSEPLPVVIKQLSLDGGKRRMYKVEVWRPAKDSASTKPAKK